MCSYLHRPLSNDDALRLLLISPPATEDDVLFHYELIETRLSDSDFPGYTALSYARGGAKTHVLQLESCAFLINEDVGTALRDLQRRDKVVRLWIEEICINQNDVEERNRQVRNIPGIYAKAKETVIYLGGDGKSPNTTNPQWNFPSTHSAWNFLERMSEWAMNEKGDVDYDLPLVRENETHRRGDLSCVEREVLSSPWFQKCSVLEVSVSKFLSLQCGRRKVPWEDFLTTVLGNPHKQTQYGGRSIPWYTKTENLQFMQYTRSTYQALHSQPPTFHQLFQGDDLDILYLLARTRNLYAFDPLEKLSSLLGITTHNGVPCKEFAIDFGKSFQEVFVAFAKWCISTGSYDILSFLENQNDFPKWSKGTSRSIKRTLPSWSPDWRVRSASSIQAPNISCGVTFHDYCRRNNPSYTGYISTSAVSGYKPRRLTILPSSTESAELKSLRSNIIKKNHSWTPSNNNQLTCQGIILGMIDSLTLQIPITIKYESDFQKLRDSSSLDEKELYEKIMERWEKILRRYAKRQFSIAEFSSIRQRDVPTINSVEHHLFTRSRKSNGEMCEGTYNAQVFDTTSIIDNRRLGIFIKSSSEKSEPEFKPKSSVQPVADADPAPKDESEEEEFGGGGLMDTMRKESKSEKARNKEAKNKKKGNKPDFIEREGPPVSKPNLAAKIRDSEEATTTENPETDTPATTKETEPLSPPPKHSTQPDSEKALVLLPSTAEPGDFIVHFTGARVAFVVRKKENHFLPPGNSNEFGMENFFCEIVGECLVNELPGLEVGGLGEEWEVVERDGEGKKTCSFVVS